MTQPVPVGSIRGWPGGARPRFAWEKTVAIPTLILAGDADPLAARAEQLAAARPGSTLTVLPGDHLAVPASAAFAMALVEFFRPR